MAAGEATAPVIPAEARQPSFVQPASGLSADYLNRVVGFSMLLDLVPEHDEVLPELAAWTRVGYRAHYEASPLPQAREAIAAWDALPEGEREAFEGLVDAVDDLARATVTALSTAGSGDLGPVARLAASALAVLIGEMRRAIEGGHADAPRARRIASHGTAQLAALRRRACSA